MKRIFILSTLSLTMTLSPFAHAQDAGQGGAASEADGSAGDEDAGGAGKATGGGTASGGSGSGGADTAPRDYDLLENDGGRGCSMTASPSSTSSGVAAALLTAGILGASRRRRR